MANRFPPVLRVDRGLFALHGDVLVVGRDDPLNRLDALWAYRQHF